MYLAEQVIVAIGNVDVVAVEFNPVGVARRDLVDRVGKVEGVTVEVACCDVGIGTACLPVLDEIDVTVVNAM